MARRNKLRKFARLQTFPQYYEPEELYAPEVVSADGQPRDLRGAWAREHFGNDAPLTLELACGRGEYTVALARANARRNFIGVDIKGARIYQGATAARAEGLDNAAWLRTRIEHIDRVFAVGEVAEIWITFPDPFPNSVNRRLIAPRFWTDYARLLAPGGRLHLKTDNEGLYAYAQELLAETTVTTAHFTLEADHPDIYAAPALPHPDLAYETYYERKHRGLGASIKWLSWTRKDTPPPSPFRYGSEGPRLATSGYGGR